MPYATDNQLSVIHMLYAIRYKLSALIRDQHGREQCV